MSKNVRLHVSTIQIRILSITILHISTQKQCVLPLNKQWYQLFCLYRLVSGVVATEWHMLFGTYVAACVVCSG